MKIPYWSDPNDEVQIIEPTDESMDKYGHRCCSDMIELSDKHIEALKAGKILAWNDGEYTTFVILKNEERS